MYPLQTTINPDFQGVVWILLQRQAQSNHNSAIIQVKFFSMCLCICFTYESSKLAPISTIDQLEKFRMKIGSDEIIETDRCRLRYPSRDDFPFISSAGRHAGFSDGMVWNPPSSQEGLIKLLKHNQKTWAAGTAYSWTVETKEKAEFLGRVEFRKTKTEQQWSLGYWIHPESQGLGYATEAAAAVVEFGFSKLKVRCISAALATWNEASGKVLKNIGMVKTGVNPEGFKKHELWVAEYEYEIRR